MLTKPLVLLKISLKRLANLVNSLLLRSLSSMPSKSDFQNLSADAKVDELFALMTHLVPLSTQLADVVNALSARFHGMEDRNDIQHKFVM